MAVFFFMSTMFPTIFTLGVANLGPDTKRGASVMMLAVGGGVVLPTPWAASPKPVARRRPSCCRPAASPWWRPMALTGPAGLRGRRGGCPRAALNR
jgi:MFS transporter, FHS family, L-fucose permease